MDQTMGTERQRKRARDLADVGVDGRQRIVEEDERLGAVGGARQRDALLLAARQVDALLADLGAVARRQQANVGRESG